MIHKPSLDKKLDRFQSASANSNPSKLMLGLLESYSFQCWSDISVLAAKGNDMSYYIRRFIGISNDAISATEQSPQGASTAVKLSSNRLLAQISLTGDIQAANLYATENHLPKVADYTNSKSLNALETLVEELEKKPIRTRLLEVGQQFSIAWASLSLNCTLRPDYAKNDCTNYARLGERIIKAAAKVSGNVREITDHVAQKVSYAILLRDHGSSAAVAAMEASLPSRSKG